MESSSTFRVWAVHPRVRSAESTVTSDGYASRWRIRESTGPPCGRTPFSLRGMVGADELHGRPVYEDARKGRPNTRTSSLS